MTEKERETESTEENAKEREDNAGERGTMRNDEDGTMDETQTQSHDLRSIEESFDSVKNIEGSVVVRYGEIESLDFKLVKLKFLICLCLGLSLSCFNLTEMKEAKLKVLKPWLKQRKRTSKKVMKLSMSTRKRKNLGKKIRWMKMRILLVDMNLKSKNQSLNLTLQKNTPNSDGGSDGHQSRQTFVTEY